MKQADELIAALRRRGESVCTVESLTGGLLCALLTEVPGASDVVRGGIVAYSMSAKRDVVGVDEQTLTTHGAVSEQVAGELARRARDIFGSTWAIATTGVAGPATQEGRPVGTVFVAVSGPRTAAVALSLAGDRQQIRTQTCVAGMRLLRDGME
ncbi:MAG: CinA family protein [Candidatus Nanopelagicales bacterium]